MNVAYGADRFLTAGRARLAAIPPGRARLLIVAATALGVLLLGALLVGPGRAYNAKYINDMVIHLDEAYRILVGQVPNRDFHTPKGPLAMLLPAAGLWLGGDFGTMMPWATVLTLLLLAPLLLHVALTRLPLGYALGAVAFTLLLAAAPVNVGENVDEISFAMFYNRWSYALLGLFCLLALPRLCAGGARWLDAAVGGVLLLWLLYLKISFGLVAVALAFLMLLIRPARAAAAGALLVVAAGALLTELIWGGTEAYFADVEAAAAASGAVRGSLFTLARIVLENFMAVALFLIAFAVGLLRGARWPFLLLALATAGAAIVLFNQNAQYENPILLVPAALLALLAPARPDAAARVPGAALTGAAAMLALAAPPTLSSAVAMAYFAMKSVRTVDAGPHEEELDGLIAQEPLPFATLPGVPALRQVYRSEKVDLELFSFARETRPRQPLAQPEYLQTVEDGMALLRRDPRLGGSTFVFDMANPFNALLGRAPPRGTDAWNHARRTLSAESHRPVGEMFADVDVILLPKAPMDLATNQLLRQVYGPHLERAYVLVATSDYWHAYARRAPRARPAAGAPA